MGGHAFRNLHCPRMSPEVYFKMREQTREVLSKIFANVVVPTEMPDKEDYGDVDFLVSGFLPSVSKTSNEWPAMIAAVSEAFNTTYCRRGQYWNGIIFSAIYAGGENDFWVQVDVKVVEKADQQSHVWEHFQLNYASGSKMLGSLIKPLGMTIDPEGLHIRVEEMEQTNLPGSMVFVSKEPRDLLEILGLDRRILHAGFESKEEIYKYFSSSWVFSSAHFRARLEDEKFVKHLEERSAPWVDFLKEWIPEHCPSTGQDPPLSEWYKTTRAAMREKVFTLFPAIAAGYYEKRAAYLSEVEEQRLRQVLMNAIPADQSGWKDDLPQPSAIVKPAAPTTPPMDTTKPNSQSVQDGDLKVPSTLPYTPPLTPSLAPSSPAGLPQLAGASTDTPIYIAPLLRDPSKAFTARPPPASMSVEARLVCIARWTLFSPLTGLPYLAREPREKKFDMCWSEHGLCDEVLVAWVKEMWWPIWMRQARVNYIGMWNRRFEKEDAKAAKATEVAEKSEKDLEKD